jgi:CPA1 family monovalent cation:H+ antiporter
VWKHITFILQALAFFLIGLEIPDVLQRLDPGDMGVLLWLVGASVLTLIVARSLFVLAMVFVTRAAKAGIAQRPTFGREAAILAWAGARGPISGLAAFSLPALTLAGTDFPSRDLVLATTFLVIVVTLILAETLGPVARMLNIPKDDDTVEIARVDGALARAALARLDAAAEELAAAGDPLSPEAMESLRSGLVRRLDRSAYIQGSSEDYSEEVRMNKLLKVASSMVHAEQEELIRMRDEDGLPDAIARPILRDLDARETALERKRQ